MSNSSTGRMRAELWTGLPTRFSLSEEPGATPSSILTERDLDLMVLGSPQQSLLLAFVILDLKLLASSLLCIKSSSYLCIKSLTSSLLHHAAFRIRFHAPARVRSWWDFDTTSP